MTLKLFVENVLQNVYRMLMFAEASRMEGTSWNVLTLVRCHS